MAELKALDFGGWFDEQFVGEPKPMLSEVLALYQGRTRLEVHLHDSSAAFLGQAIEEVERFGMLGDVELTTAHYPLLTEIKKLNPDLRTGTCFNEPPDWMPIRLARRHNIATSTCALGEIANTDVGCLSWLRRGSARTCRNWRVG